MSALVRYGGLSVRARSVRRSSRLARGGTFGRRLRPPDGSCSSRRRSGMGASTSSPSRWGSPAPSSRSRDDDEVMPCRPSFNSRSEEHTSELQSRLHLVCRLLLEKKNICKKNKNHEQHKDNNKHHHLLN